MRLSRRTFLQQSGLLAAYAIFPAWLRQCGVAPDANPAAADPAVWLDEPPPAGEQAALLHLLNRITFGPRPGDLERVAAIGAEAFLDQQLTPESIDDQRLERQLATLSSLNMEPAALYKAYRPGQQPGPRRAVAELQAAALLRAINSERQLFELMVDFWSNHFNIFAGRPIVGLLKIVDDREVIRRHALGSFRELLLASARSPAMLVYLDNIRNTRSIRLAGKSRGGINENYARELLELHTVGVAAGYSQEDVVAVAETLTGWSVAPPDQPDAGRFRFVPRLHDDRARHIPFLELDLPAGAGTAAGEQLLTRLAEHPATARRIAGKLAAYFVQDDPPPALVERAAQVYLQHATDIKATLRSIFSSDEFAAAAGQKIKLPLRYVASAVRAGGAELRLNSGRQRLPELLQALSELGQAPFFWAPPDGYPQAGTAWINTGGMLGRWNLAFALAEGRIEGVAPDPAQLAGNGDAAEQVTRLGAALLPGGLSTAMEAALVAYADDAGDDAAARQRKPAGIAGLMLASPAFQYH